MIHSQKTHIWRKKRGEHSNPRRRPSSSSLCSNPTLSFVSIISPFPTLFLSIFYMFQSSLNILYFIKVLKKIHFKSRDMKNPCLGQIPSQEKSKQDKTSGAQLLGTSSFFFYHGLPEKGAQYVP